MEHPERIVPDEVPAGIVEVHLKRYAFAAPLCAGRIVLDAACGVGYGSAYLGRVAERVLGVDVSEEAIAYARSKYAGPNVSFERMDLLALDLPDGSFSAACAFEAIEHVEDPDQGIRELARALRPDGVCILSTPNAPETTAEPLNPYHRRELAAPDFAALLGRHFSEVELYGQRRLTTRRHALARRLDVLGLRRRAAWGRRLVSKRILGTHATEDLTADDLLIEEGVPPDATELVAVCRRPRARRDA